jgi:hypothetical protein
LKISSYVIVETGAERLDTERAQGMVPKTVPSVLVLGLFVLLAFGILAFGAVHEWSTFLFEAGSVVLFLIWAGMQFASGQVKLSNNPLYLPALCFFLLVLAQIGLRTSAYG